MSNTTQNPTPAELKWGGSWKMIIPFALLPLAIVSAAVGLFLLFGRMAEKHETAKDYLAQLHSSSQHRRWQAAYELSRFLAQGNLGENKADVESELLGLLKNAPADENLFRRYLIVSLGQIGTEKSATPLLELARSSPDSEIKIYALWALGRMKAQASAPLMRELLGSDDAGFRKTAAFSLGFVGEASDVSRLATLLDDPIQDVRWNAALGLAQLGSQAGRHEILFLLDPSNVRKATPNLRENERTQILLTALTAATKSRLREAIPLVERFQDPQTDPVLKAAATQALKTLNTF